MGEISTITYESIYDLVRKEKNDHAIQELNPDIYNQIIQYLKTKIDIYKSSKDQLNPSELDKLKEQIVSTRKLIKELYERREKKILQLAVNKSRTKAEINDSLLKEEKLLLNDVTKNLDHYRNEILLNLVNARHPFGKKPEIKKENKRTKIRFLSPVPKFMGTELEVYGPFDEGDIAELPSILAEVLLKRERAEEI